MFFPSEFFFMKHSQDSSGAMQTAGSGCRGSGSGHAGQVAQLNGSSVMWHSEFWDDWRQVLAQLHISRGLRLIVCRMRRAQTSKCSRRRQVNDGRTPSERG